MTHVHRDPGKHRMTVTAELTVRVAMGMEEGTQGAMGQIDGIVANG